MYLNNTKQSIVTFEMLFLFGSVEFSKEIKYKLKSDLFY